MDRYEVILINSGVGYAALCPGIPTPCRKAPTGMMPWR